MGSGISGTIAKAGSSVAGWWGKRAARKGGKKVAKAGGGPLKALGALQKEASQSPVLHKDVLSALHRMQAKDPSLERLLKKAHGYAIFPAVGKASAVLGGAYGIGEVFSGDRVIGYAGLIQLTIGLQLGGQTYHELVVFESREALDQFKQNKTSFAANASAVFVKAGAAASASPGGTRVFVHSEGGLGVEAALGGQKFIFKPAVLGRSKTATPLRVPGKDKGGGEAGAQPPATH